MTAAVCLLPAERFAHGTRSRYVKGCRCTECRASNTACYHERKRRGLEAAGDLGGTATSGPCPGVSGASCPIGARLRRDSKGGVCGACRDRLSFNGLVDAAPARKHLRYLSRSGVGRDAVSAACDVGVTVLSEVFRGAKRQIRARTLAAILRVTAAARADAATVPAGATWKLIDKMLADGWTRSEIARRLGATATIPALQLRRDRVLARTALKVKRLAATIGAPPARGTRWKPMFCDCLSPTADGRRCSACGHFLRPAGMTQAIIAGGPEKAKPVHRAFGYEGGWGFEQRTSKKAKHREDLELRKLARAAARERAA